MFENGPAVVVLALHQVAGGDLAVVEVIHLLDQQSQGRQAVQEDARRPGVGLEPGRGFHRAAGLVQKVEHGQVHRHREHLGRLESPGHGHELFETAFRVQSHGYSPFAEIVEVAGRNRNSF